jgi:antitoxin (DNA-binding transcriptional repressor) of toxin-antitoxin stability system
MMSNESVCSEKMSEDNDDDNPIHVEEDLALLSREELVARIIAARQRRRVDRQLIRGTYYSTIDHVWRGERRQIAREDAHLFDMLNRAEAPSFVAPDGANHYDETLRKAKSRKYKPAKDVRRSSSLLEDEDTTSSRRHADDIWPCDIFGTRNSPAPVARLVPSDRDAAAAYVDVAIAALALDDECSSNSSSSSWGTIQKALHGSERRGLLASAVRAVAGLRYGRRRRRRRESTTTTGIKHSVPNRIRLSGQAECYDQRPCVLIVPTMTLDEVKRWNGQGYRAIVMVGPPPRDDESLDSDGDGDDDENLDHVKSICVGIHLLDAGDVALPEQVEAARTLLSQFVLGFAYSLLHRSLTYRRYMSRRQRAELDRRRRVFCENAAAGVVLPAAAEPLPPPQRPWRVRLVNFRGATDARSNHHVAPDPFLLTVKAAVNWSRRHHQQLLAAAEPQDEGLGEPELYAMEEYMAWHARAIRPPENRDELAAQLRQSPTHRQRP